MRAGAVSAAIVRHKHFLRGLYRRALRAMPAAARRRESLNIARRLGRLPEFRRAQTVAVYLSRNNEVDTRPIRALCRKLNKELAVPVVFPETRRMSFFAWPRRRSLLRRNVYGLWEPSPDKVRAVAARSIDLFLVPGLAFTPRGDRLGSGGGYYDRFLRRVPRTPRIGLAFGVQEAVRLPRAAHDQRMTGVLTAEGFLRTS